MRVPNAGKDEQERQLLIRRLEKKLSYFQSIPPHQRDGECADEGERDCWALLAELRAPGYERLAAGELMQTLDEFLEGIEGK